ncbi:hypothetical protein ARMGADRAFT_1048524 [Armillaria gallica]|uniref:Uncharacterized protein n=1 Tax=Armillaria gallica TaxID=47427 RepID=A0A2H3D6C0_ARMGA|nr:hypothetical protein ARMGADRAFT_1048524 [Armillaria gallica]
MGNSCFAEHMKYAPEQVYTDENGQSQAYSEMSTADWWWAMQKLLPKGATIAAVIVATDKMQLSRFSGDKQVWPVYLTIGNINKDIRQKPSEHMTVLIGYLPVSKLECFSKKTQSTQSYQLFHTCMHSLLDPLVSAGKNGIKMLCADGKMRLVYPLLAAYVADYPEQYLVRCCMETVAQMCDPEKMINILKQTSDSHKPKVFTKQRLHLVDLFWRKLPHCNIFNCFIPNILHQLHKGMFKDHVISWSTEAVDADKLKEELDCHFRAMTCHPSLKNMEKVFLLVLNVLDFIYYYYTHFEEHTDESLSKLDEVWHTLHDKKAVFINLDIWQHFNIPKVHSTTHYALMIQSHGTADGFNTEASECLHIDFAKVAYNASNKKDYVKQMTTWLRRREAVDNFDRFLDWAVEEYDELENNNVEGEEEDEDNVEAVGTESEAVPADWANNPSTYSVSKFPLFRNVDLDTLDKKYSATKFVYALESFLSKYEVFKQCQIYIPLTPEVLKLVTIDPIRASPMWFTPLHSLDDHVRMFKVHCSTHGGQRLKASIIPVTYFSQSCQLTPYFGCSMDCTWTSDNVLDVCQSFHVNSYL